MLENKGGFVVRTSFRTVITSVLNLVENEAHLARIWAVYWCWIYWPCS